MLFQLMLFLFVWLLDAVDCVTKSTPKIKSKPPHKYMCTAEGWVNNGDTCYHVLDRTTKWHKVQSLCDALKAKFAYVDDQNDMDALARAATLRSAPTVWVMGSNTDTQKIGKFVWRDGARTEVDGANTPWAPGYPKPNSPLNQFLYMKIDLESLRSNGLAHSADHVDRYVACMLPAKDKVEAEAQKLAKKLEDPLLQTTKSVRNRKFRKNLRLS